MSPFQQLLKRLADNDVRFVVIGGVAATAHGSPLVTHDVDVCAPLDQDNLGRIIQALRDLEPRFRMHPAKPPLPEQAAQLAGFRNLCLVTQPGVIDILSEVTGVGSYDDVEQHSVTMDLGGFQCRVLDLETLIIAKRAAGRNKDMRTVTELEAIRQRRRASGSPS